MLYLLISIFTSLSNDENLSTAIFSTPSSTPNYSSNKEKLEKKIFFTNAIAKPILIDIRQMNSSGSYECKDNDTNFNYISNNQSNINIDTSKTKDFASECWTIESNFSYTFKGEKFLIYGMNSKNYGKFYIEIDGQLVKEINENSTTSNAITIIFESDILEYKDHIIRIISKGEKYSLTKLVYWPTITSKRKNCNEIKKAGKWEIKSDKYGQITEFSKLGGSLNVDFKFKRLWLYFTCDINHINQFKLNFNNSLANYSTSLLKADDYFHAFEIRKINSNNDQLTISTPSNFSIYFIYYEEMKNKSDTLIPNANENNNEISSSFLNTKKIESKLIIKHGDFFNSSKYKNHHFNENNEIHNDTKNEEKYVKEELPNEIIIEDVYLETFNQSSAYVIEIDSPNAYMRNNTYDFSNLEYTGGVYKFNGNGNITIINCNFIFLYDCSIYYQPGSLSSENDYLLIENCTFQECSFKCIHVVSRSGSLEAITVCNCSFVECSEYQDPICFFSADSIRLNIINNKFDECNLYLPDLCVIYIKCNNRLIDDPIAIENNIFRNSCNAIRIDQENSCISIYNCQFKNLTDKPILFEQTTKVSINKCYFENCSSMIDINDRISEARIEDCIFSNIYNKKQYNSFIISVNNQNFIFNKNIINFTLNGTSESIGGLSIRKHGDIIITNNHFINFRQRVFLIYDDDNNEIDSTGKEIICNYNTIESAIGPEYGVLRITKKNLIEFNHNIIKDCKFITEKMYLTILSNNAFNDIFTISNFTCINCTSSAETGGGIGLYIHSYSSIFKIILKDCTFINNTNENQDFGYGGAFSAEASSQTKIEFLSDNCTFIRNQAMLGGAIFIQSTLQSTITNCTFIDNEAIKGGGAIYIYPKYYKNLGQLPSCSITGCQFESNKDSSNNGHAIFFEYIDNCYTTIQIKECNFNDNSHGINSHEGFTISLNSPDATIENIKIDFLDPTRSNTGIKADKMIRMLRINYCTINNIIGPPSFIFYNNNIKIADLQIQNCQSDTTNKEASIIYMSNINSILFQNSTISSCISYNIFYIDNSYSDLHFRNIIFNSNLINNDQKSFLFAFKNELMNTDFERIHSDSPIIKIPDSKSQVTLNRVTFEKCVSDCLIQDYHSNLDIKNCNFISNEIPIIDKKNGGLSFYNSNFINCMNGLEIKKEFPNVNIEKCVFTDCLDNVSNSVLIIYNYQFSFNNNTINFTSNDYGKSISGIHIKSHGDIEITNNQFVNIRKTNISGITIDESEYDNSLPDSTVIFNYNTILNAANLDFGVLSINKQQRFEFNHNIIKDCKMHAGYAAFIHLQDGNKFNNDITIINLTVDSCTSNCITGGGFGLLLEFGTNNIGTLRFRNCHFKYNSIENIIVDNSGGSGCGGAFETGNLTNSNLEFIAEYCEFIGNQAPKCGGALSIQSTMQATIKNCTFINNEAGEGGGAIYIYPKKYESTNGIDNQMPSCIISGCKFESNKDSSNNGHAIFFKYFEDCITSLSITECDFKDNSHKTNSYEGFTISTESPTFSIEGSSFKFSSSIKSNTVLKVDKNTEILTVNRCQIENIDGCPSCSLHSKSTNINDFIIRYYTMKKFAAIEIEYNGPIIINQMKVYNTNDAIEFLSLPSDQLIQVDISNSIFSNVMSVIKSPNDSIKLIQGLNIKSCTADNYVISFTQASLQKKILTDCHFISTKAKYIIYHHPTNLLTSTESLIIEDCTFKNCSDCCIYVYPISGSSETITVCNCSFYSMNLASCVIYADGRFDSAKLNIINNEFIECGYNWARYSIKIFCNPKDGVNQIIIENNIFQNISGAIEIRQIGGYISIDNCQFENMPTNSIVIYEMSHISMNKCNFSNCENAIRLAGLDRDYNVGYDCKITECIFKSNSHSDGGSLYISSSYIISILECQFIENRAKQNGGAIYINRISDGKLNIENCTFDHNSATIDSAFYIWKTVNSSIDISNCSFINNEENKNMIYSTCDNLIIHDISFIYKRTESNFQPILLGPGSGTEVYNAYFNINTMNDEEGIAISGNEGIETLNVHDCKFEDCKDTGSSIKCIGSNFLFSRNVFTCTKTSTCSGINIQDAIHIEIIECSFIRMSSKRSENRISPLNIKTNKKNEKVVLIGLIFANCSGRNPICFSIEAYKPFTLENITIKNNIIDQFESYIGVIDLNDYMGDDPLAFKYCNWINNCVFTQYGNGAGIWINNKSKFKYEFENCLFENNQHSQNGGGFQDGGCAENVNRILSFSDCIFNGNKADEKGGGLSIETVLPFNIERCTFSNNRAEMGGAIYINPTYRSISNEYGSITDCTFNNNEASLEQGTILCIENSKTNQIIFDGSNNFINNGERGSTIYSQSGDLKLIGILFDFNLTQGSNVKKNFRSVQLIKGSITTLTNCKFIGNGFTTSPTSGHAIKAEEMTKKVVFENCVFTDCGDSNLQYAIDSFSSEIEFTSSVINFTDPQVSCGGIKINQYSKLTLINSTFKNCFSGLCYNSEKLGDKVNCDVSISGCTFDSLLSSDGSACLLMLAKSISIFNCTIKNMLNINHSLVIKYDSQQQEQTTLDSIAFIDNQINVDDRNEITGIGILISKVNKLVFNGCHFIRNIKQKVNASDSKFELSCLVQLEFVGCFFEDNKAQSNINGGGLCINAIYKPVVVIIDNCHFKSNKSPQNGGAVSIISFNLIRIINSTFVENVANYKQNSQLLASDQDDSTLDGKGGSIYIYPVYETDDSMDSESYESSIQIENCVFKNNEAFDGSSIYLSGENQGNKISITNNEFISRKSDSFVILTEICSFSDDQIISGNTFNVETENGFIEDTNILSKNCIYTPTIAIVTTNEFTKSFTFSVSNYFTESGQFTSSKSFSGGNAITSSGTLLIKEDEYSPSSKPTQDVQQIRHVTVSMSYSLSYTKQRSVSFSLSYYLSNTFEMIFDYSKGTYTMVMTQKNYYSYFPYIIYYLSPMYIQRNVTINLVRKSTITPEQLIGVVCGSVSVFFLVLGIIILALKKRNENQEQFDEFDDISSSEVEIYYKDNETNQVNECLIENTTTVPEIYSELLT